MIFGVMIVELGVKCVLLVVSFMCVYFDVMRVCRCCSMYVSRNIVLILR